MTIIACCRAKDGRLFMLADSLVGHSVQYPASAPKLFTLLGDVVYGVSGDCFAWDDKAFGDLVLSCPTISTIREYFRNLAAQGVDVGIMLFDPRLAPLPVIFYSGDQIDGSNVAVTFVGRPGAKPATGSLHGLAVTSPLVEGGSLPDVDVLVKRVQHYHASHGYDNLPVRTIQLFPLSVETLK